jgi:hypothetical protein
MDERFHAQLFNNVSAMNCARGNAKAMLHLEELCAKHAFHDRIGEIQDA